jgi:hypothetical protein
VAHPEFERAFADIKNFIGTARGGIAELERQNEKLRELLGLAMDCILPDVDTVFYTGMLQADFDAALEVIQKVLLTVKQALVDDD